MAQSPVWTPEKVEAVRELTAQGFNSTQIGNRFGVSRNAIVSLWRRWDMESKNALTPDKIARIQQTRRPGYWTKAKLDRIQALLLQGHTLAVVGDVFGVNKGVISRLAVKHGLKGVNKRGTNGKEKLIKTMPDIGVGEPFAERFSEGFDGQSGSVELANHKDHQCRFPVDQEDGSVKFCGDRAKQGSAYCPVHHARCCTGRTAITQERKQRVAA